MYIEPNTTVRILKNCPLDTTYDHTLYFLNKSQQVNYFSSLSKYTLKAYSYQRVNANTIRVEVKADNLYDCNYIMFQNSNFGDKWFYAFIKSVEYINNITSAIEYEIDVMQTWHFDYQLGQCFVEREHSATDKIGDNIVDEKLNIGEYVVDEEASDTDRLYKDMKWVLASTFKPVAGVFRANYSGGIWGGLWSGLYYNVFDTYEQMQTFIDNAGALTIEGIVCAFMIPSAFVTEENGNELEPRTSGFMLPNGFSRRGTKRAFEGYTPVNNKLYTYPYNLLYVTNLQGEGVAFKYELFSQPSSATEYGTPHFATIASMTANPECTVYPQYYAGIDDNLDERLTVRGWPMLSWNSDAFKAYLAQSASAISAAGLATLSMAANPDQSTSAVTALTVAGTAASASPIGATVAAGLMVASALGGAVTAKLTPPRNHPGSGCSALAADNKLGFLYLRKHIRKEYAKIIDDYFTMYGYATHEVKVPNRNARPHWTYTKTIGCVVHGSVPCDDMSKICSIFNNGITFWNNGREVGDYTLDNSPRY